MKILIFSLSYFPHVGGAEIAIKEITDRLPGSTFHLLTLRFAGEPVEERLGNVVVHRIGSGNSYLQKILFIPRAAQAARLLQREHAFDLWWAMMTYMLLPVVLARPAGLRVPYLLTLQDGDPFEHVFDRLRLRLFRPLLRYGFRHARAVQAISTFLAGWARAAGYRGSVTVIPNGVNLKLFLREHARPRRMDDLVLVTTSRLVHKNAIDDIIRALVLLPVTVRLHVYGSGVEERRLRSLALQLGVESRAIFKSSVPHGALPTILDESDVFIRPSRSEGMGISFIEAMAAGVPVVATQVGGISDFLFDSKRNPEMRATGWAVDQNTPEQIANAVKDIVTNPAKTLLITTEAQRMVRAQYDWDHISSEMETLFKSVSEARSMAV